MTSLGAPGSRCWSLGVHGAQHPGQDTPGSVFLLKLGVFALPHSRAGCCQHRLPRTLHGWSLPHLGDIVHHRHAHSLPQHGPCSLPGRPTRGKLVTLMVPQGGILFTKPDFEKLLKSISFFHPVSGLTVTRVKTIWHLFFNYVNPGYVSFLLSITCRLFGFSG